MLIPSAFRKRFVTWLCDPDRERCLFWIDDPNHDAPHRRLSLVNSLCYLVKKAHRLVNTDASISHIISTLAANYPPYRRLLAIELMEDPLIFGRSPRHQFRTLILEPWEELGITHPQYVGAPPVVIVSQATTSHIVNWKSLLHVLNVYAARLNCNCPLLWVICAQPVYFGRVICPELPIQWEYAQLSVLDAQLQDATRRTLRREVDNLRAQSLWLPDTLEGSFWPSERDISRLAQIISGSSWFLDAAIRFIANGGTRGPMEQLHRFLQYTVNSPTPTNFEPMRALYHFYSEFLSDITPKLAHNVMLIIENVSTRQPRHGRGINHHASFDPKALAFSTGLSREEFYAAFGELRWISTSYNFPREISVDPSLRRFLTLSTYSGELRIRPSACLRLKSYLHFLSYLNFSRLLCAFRWNPSNPLMEAEGIAKKVKRSALLVNYTIANTIKKGSGDYIFSDLLKFDFRCFALTCNRFRVTDFARFLVALHEKRDHLQDLVRTTPTSPLDLEFIKQCKKIALPLDLSRFDPQSLQTPRYALLGNGEQTVLAILVKPLHGESATVSIYSQEMLEEG
ncbi:hypothetical protein AN958_09016 [Leucoagaricus sp. SymC.cos]|nr:hypothetical protein AN958_09016 [Leucoagaricus sp. SymC.cos]